MLLVVVLLAEVTLAAAAPQRWPLVQVLFVSGDRCSVSSNRASPSAHIHTDDHCNDKTNAQDETTQGKHRVHDVNTSTDVMIRRRIA
ncbi:hypothetical protein VIGAN_06133000 [Vigna angularis var. angularis]|uniref:Secreted protein n=1 Tax=Vigna angularis var. angularis TaxID=157739 RepID=A0A0S3SBA3_PHAAN|nr:hypothetical protein VIGAN_06133000 [Vigna angularis var. angularis]